MLRADTMLLLRGGAFKDRTDMRSAWVANRFLVLFLRPVMVTWERPSSDGSILLALDRVSSDLSVNSDAV